MPGDFPIHLFTLVCEDIRQETLGKVSLLGVYNENIFFQKSPMRIRSLAFFTRFRGGKGTFSLLPRLRGPSGDLKKPDEPKSTTFPASSESEHTLLGLVLGGIEFAEQGAYFYEIFFDDSPEPFVQVPLKVAIRPEVFR